MAIAHKISSNLDLSQAGSYLVEYEHQGNSLVTIDPQGNINIPDGATYNINGNPISGGGSGSITVGNGLNNNNGPVNLGGNITEQTSLTLDPNTEFKVAWNPCGLSIIVCFKPFWVNASFAKFHIVFVADIDGLNANRPGVTLPIVAIYEFWASPSALIFW